MDKAINNFLVVVQVVWWPISKLTNAFRIILSPFLHAVIFLLSPIWMVGGFLLLPLVHLVKGLFNIVTLPLQVKWLERIETLYIYLGTACLIGCATGAALHLVFKFLSSSLGINATSRAQPRKGRTAAEFRAARRGKQDRASVLATPPTQVVLDKAPGYRGYGLLSQVIVEEEDSDF